jgi:hypothetical protein
LHGKHAAFNDGGKKVASRAIIQGGIHESLVVVEASNRYDIRMVADKPLKRNLPGFSSRFLSPLAYALDGENRASLDLESTIDGAETTGAYLLDEFDLSRPNDLSGHIWKISRREVHDAAKAARAEDLYATRAVKEQKKAQDARKMEGADQGALPLRSHSQLLLSQQVSPYSTRLESGPRREGRWGPSHSRYSECDHVGGLESNPRLVFRDDSEVGWN